METAWLILVHDFLFYFSAYLFTVYLSYFGAFCVLTKSARELILKNMEYLNSSLFSAKYTKGAFE